MKLVRKISIFMALVLMLTMVNVGSLGTVEAYLDKPFIHSMFADHMVLQRDVENPVWGWTTPGEKVTVEIGGKLSIPNLSLQSLIREGKSLLYLKSFSVLPSP